MSDLGQKIRASRKSKRMSQQELAEKLGVVRAAVSAWEQNKRTPRLKIYLKLIDLLDISDKGVN